MSATSAPLPTLDVSQTPAVPFGRLVSVELRKSFDTRAGRAYSLSVVGLCVVVMLVIAADESVMPQTREHLAICELLRVQQGLTVLTKIDAVERDIGVTMLLSW